MEVIFTILAVFLILVVLGVLFFLFRRLRQLEISLRGEEILQRLELHKGELGANLRSLDERLHTVTTEIGGVKEVTAQLQDFQKSLKSQKERGNVGEMVLEDLLHQILPADAYQMQFSLRIGDRDKTVDAVVKTRQGFIPVDSKFPVEGFQAWVSAPEPEKESKWREFVRGVKKRMDETAVYIASDQGTTPFALMYIPFEPIFQEVVSDPELMRYTLTKRVYFSSPQTFFVIIKIILLGLQRERFAEQAGEILSMLHAVTTDAVSFESILKTASSHVSDAKNKMDEVVNKFSQLLGKLEQLKDLEAKPRSELRSTTGAKPK